jgi:transmembrane 9 superfamily member 2/4
MNLGFVACRILDNLPLVVPIKRLDQEAPTVYQQGVHVGVKGQYAGVG